jgi:predicted PurR-regulated permease PerM
MVQERDPDLTPRWLRRQAAYAWRFLVVIAFLAVIARAVMAVQLLAVAIFIALVITAVLRPLVNLLGHIMPRALGTALSFIVALGALAGIGTFVGVSVGNQIPQLSAELADGLDQIDQMLADAPAPLSDIDLSNLGNTVETWVRENSDSIFSEVVQRVGAVAELLTALFLSIFCSVFFVTSGHRMWDWFLRQLSTGVRERLGTAGSAAWTTFSGYTRGIVIVAATNGLFAGLGLAIIGIPLSAPIGVLVFLGTFIPYIGAALAMSVAIIIALAAKGIIWALVVIAMITLIGQIEGHLLQPLIMSKQVKIHPVAVAVAVVAGTLVGGIVGAVTAVPLVSVCWSVFSALRKLDRAEELELEAGVDGEVVAQATVGVVAQATVAEATVVEAAGADVAVDVAVDLGPESEAPTGPDQRGSMD